MTQTEDLYPGARYLSPIPGPLNLTSEALTGKTVKLEPLAERHLEGLCKVGLDPDLWRYIPISVTTKEAMADYIRGALADRANSVALPFATTLAATGEVVGSTRFGNIDRVNRRVEIGWTFVGKAWQRSPVNTEAKYLMLMHAFETLGCVRVEFKTDSFNHRSRTAIARLGAKEEGIFRQHVIAQGGRLRDSVYFSILDTEWPAVKAGLEGRMTA